MTEPELSIKECANYAKGMAYAYRAFLHAEEVLTMAASVELAQSQQRKAYDALLQENDLLKGAIAKNKDELSDTEEASRQTLAKISLSQADATRDFEGVKAQIAADRQSMLDELAAKRASMLASHASEAAERQTVIDKANDELKEVKAKQRAAEAAIATMRGQVEGLKV